MPPEVEKFHGPTFEALMDVPSRKQHSLIRKVSLCSPVELGAIVIGSAVYEVFMDMPECEDLNGAMASVKQKQARLPPGRALRWMNGNLTIKQEEDKSRLMEVQDMRLFLSRCPISVLSNAVFNPFLPIVRKFLLNKLFQFTKENPLYHVLPEFPSEKRLPAMVNALGPMDQLSKNYPHLARMKHEMIFNIMDFTVKYCMDWVSELLLLRCDSNGKVEYYCPPVEVELQKRKSSSGKKPKRPKKDRKSSSTKQDKIQRKADSDDSGWETQTLTNSSSSCSSNLEDLKNEPEKKRSKVEVIELKEEEEEDSQPAIKPSSSGGIVPSHQEAEDPQPASQQTPQDHPPPQVPAPLPVPAYSMIHDDWSDMLTMALTDPSLAPHYKTMIHCLVASNRDMKNMIVMMRTQPS